MLLMWNLRLHRGIDFFSLQPDCRKKHPNIEIHVGNLTHQLTVDYTVGTTNCQKLSSDKLWVKMHQCAISKSKRSIPSVPFSLIGELYSVKPASLAQRHCMKVEWWAILMKQNLNAFSFFHGQKKYKIRVSVECRVSTKIWWT